MESLEKSVVVVSPLFTTYGGEHVMLRKDLPNSVDLPDEKLVNLGSKRVIDPKYLIPFHKLRKRVTAAVSRKGVQILDGYAQNPNLVKDVIKEVEVILDEARTHSKFIVDHWDQLVKEWADANPKWETMIRDGAPSKGWVSNRFNFGVRAYPLSLSQLEAMGIAGNNLVQEVENLGDRLTRELYETAQNMWADFMKRPKIGVRQLSPIKSLEEKAKALSFLDIRARKVAEDLQALITGLPNKGPYEKELPAILRVLRGVMLLTSPTDTEDAYKGSETVEEQKKSPEETEMPEIEPNRVWLI